MWPGNDRFSGSVVVLDGLECFRQESDALLPGIVVLRRKLALLDVVERAGTTALQGCQPPSQLVRSRGLSPARLDLTLQVWWHLSTGRPVFGRGPGLLLVPLRGPWLVWIVGVVLKESSPDHAILHRFHHVKCRTGRHLDHVPEVGNNGAPEWRNPVS